MVHINIQWMMAGFASSSDKKRATQAAAAKKRGRSCQDFGVQPGLERSTNKMDVILYCELINGLALQFYVLQLTCSADYCGGPSSVAY